MNTLRKPHHVMTGFSLIEVMIAIVIVAIIAAVALPAYQEHVMRGNRTDCHGALVEAANRLERFFYDNNTYTADFTDLGYDEETDISTQHGKYVFSVDTATETCPINTCFVLRCEPQGAQSDDGDLTLDSTGIKSPSDKW